MSASNSPLSHDWVWEVLNEKFNVAPHGIGHVDITCSKTNTLVFRGDQVSALHFYRAEAQKIVDELEQILLGGSE